MQKGECCRARVFHVLLALTLLQPAAFGAFAATAESPARRVKVDRSDAFFADPVVRVFRVELSPAALTMLRQRPSGYVYGAVSEGANVFTNVGIHLKGMGSFRRVDEKPSLVLKFNQFAAGQEYRGLTKLMLNNSTQDHTYLAEFLATSLFRDAGVPAARVTHSRVVLNGRDLGLYVAIEAMDKQFLKRNFRNSKGNLYEGYLADIDTQLEQDNGEQGGQVDLRALLAACAIPDRSERFRQLDQLLDVDRFARFAAMEMLTAHWDGYTWHTNNYRLYHDPKSDKFVFITHGLDGVFRRPNVSVKPPMKSTVSRALFETAEGRKIYEQHVRTLYTNIFRVEVMTNRIERAVAKLRGAELPSAEFAALENNAWLMRDAIVARVNRVGEELSGIPPGPLQFDKNGLARVSHWREEFDRGEPVLDRVNDAGKAALHIKAAGGVCRCSWRSMIFLEPGRYRFEGELRSVGLSAGGAGLRISGDTRNMRVTGNNPWRPVQHEFSVKEEDGADVELVCEFHALTGEAWYEVDSLRVRKL